METLEILKEIKRTAEIALEHQKSKASMNNLITVALGNIVSKCETAIDEIENGEKEG